jgi:hypothetical protein
MGLTGTQPQRVFYRNCIPAGNWKIYDSDQIRFGNDIHFNNNIKPKWIKTFVYAASITVLWLLLSLSVKAGAVTILSTDRNENKPFFVYFWFRVFFERCARATQATYHPRTAKFLPQINNLSDLYWTAPSRMLSTQENHFAINTDNKSGTCFIRKESRTINHISRRSCHGNWFFVKLFNEHV